MEGRMNYDLYYAERVYSVDPFWVLSDAFSNAEQGEGAELPGAGWEVDLKTVIPSVHLDADETAVEFARRFPSPHFAVTAKGYLGVVPGGTEVGDAICVFPGGGVPFLLRKKSESSSRHYSLIRECYIHGIMFGEDKLFENAAAAETFSLE
ncbi:hypothetical protein B0T25DRAFT_586421 [Lasiosphaeria hispida]|uniref:Uncharacterized protein n=1 Tax=Lasiosphaeria hispida TaxID=260671 RepID=A0AAJ0H5Y0_9PEZI|nr:hypothetical protein B0T25DRAFT_586421 [Lasiosphaeria hispida]